MLKIEHVCKTFNKGTINEKAALKDLNLELEKGDFVTVIGGNGAGKSTMLNMIAGVYPVDEGRILIDGTDITGQPDYRRAAYLGRVFQDPMMGTAADMELQENLAMAYRRGHRRGLRWGISAKEKKIYREHLASLGLGLEDRMTTKVGLLSGGQRQAIALLMSTMTPIDFLILDEHTAALDPKTAEIIMGLTDRIVKEKRLTTIMVTHNLRYAVEYGNRMLMMHQGKCILDRAGKEKEETTVEMILNLFNEISIECGN